MPAQVLVSGTIPSELPRQKAPDLRIFTLAGIDDAQVAIKLAKLLDEPQAAGFREFKRKAKEAIGAGSGNLRDAQLEFVFRNYVMGRFGEEMDRRADNPIVDAVFPYASIDPVHDGRTTEEHAALETLGIDGTNIYRRDDPVWQRFQPPWGLHCRCSAVMMRVADAAREGIEEAQQWLATGQPPTKPAWVPMPPFDPELTPCEILGVRGELPYLLKRLDHKDDREWVIEILGEIGPNAIVVSTFVDLLRSGKADVRRQVLDALDEWGPDELARVAVRMPDLLRVLASEGESNWIEVLDKIGPDTTVVPALLDLLRTPEPDVRQQVLDALEWHTDVVVRLAKESPDLLLALVNAGGANWVAEVLEEIGPDAKPAVPVLTDLMASAENELVRLAATMALWKIQKRVELVLPALLDRLKSRRADVRCRSLEALKQLRAAASDALPAILLRLRDEDASVRCAAIGAAASVAPASADVVAAITQTLRDTEGSVRFEGAHALIWYGPVAMGALPTCLQILRDKRELGRAEVSALVARIAADSPQVVEALIAALKDRRGSVRTSVVNALAEIGPAAKAALPALALMRQDRAKQVREAVAKALKRIAPDATAGDGVA